MMIKWIPNLKQGYLLVNNFHINFGFKVRLRWINQYDGIIQTEHVHGPTLDTGRFYPGFCR